MRLGVGVATLSPDGSPLTGEALVGSARTAERLGFDSLWFFDAMSRGWPAALGGPAVLIGSWGGKHWIPRAAQEFDGWIASAGRTNLNTLTEGIRRYRAAGGKRAIVTNIAVDLSSPTELCPDDRPFHLRCAMNRDRKSVV